MIAAVLLVVVDSEEEAFWLMICLLTGYKMGDYFRDGINNLNYFYSGVFFKRFAVWLFG